MINMTPALGQRWISDAEPELGLGLVVEADPRTMTILFLRAPES